jgi:IS1 family transposase
MHLCEDLRIRHGQIDEIWGFVGAKAANASQEKKARREQGDVWVWLATDADTKLVPCWHVGRRNMGAAIRFMNDLASRLSDRIQLTSDALKAYSDAVELAFGGDVDYAQVVKSSARFPRASRAATARPNASVCGSSALRATPTRRT